MSERVYLDACVFLAWLKDEPDRRESVAALFEKGSNGELCIATSTFTLVEVLNLKGYNSPIPKGDRDAVEGLLGREWVQTFSLIDRVGKIAREVVWEHGVKPKDSIHVATAIAYRIPLMYSYDNPLINRGTIETPFGSVCVEQPPPAG